MTKVLVGLGLVMLCTSCGGAPKKLAQACTSSLAGTAQGDCDTGLICEINDACVGSCAGRCVKSCQTNSDCPTGCACATNGNVVNGGQAICNGTGC